MANTIKIKRSAVAGKAPAVGDLQLGELAINTFDGKLYTKKDNGTASVVEIGAGGSASPVLQYDTSLAENVTLSTGFNGVALDDVAVEGGYTLEVPDGQTFTIGSFDAISPVTAGAGLTQVGSALDVGTASSSRIVVNADNIDLATTGVSAGTYTSVTVDTYGRVTAGSNSSSLTSVAQFANYQSTIYKTDVGSGNYTFDKGSFTWTAPRTGTVLIQAYVQDAYTLAGWASGNLFVTLVFNSINVMAVDCLFGTYIQNGSSIGSGVAIPPLLGTQNVTQGQSYTILLRFMFQNFIAATGQSPAFNYNGNSTGPSIVVFTYV